MEYCEGGDLSQLIKRCSRSKDYISEDVIWKIFTQVVMALHICHTYKEGKILHRDIKPSNIFLDKDNNVKLGDFGLSKVLSKEIDFTQSNVGTPYYMSPEQIHETKYNEKSDIWSLGCFLYEMVTLKPPFQATNPLSLAIKIKAGKVKKIEDKYSDELSRVIMLMMNSNLNCRPSTNDLLLIPQVNLRVREQRLKDNYVKLKKIEENIKEKEKSLNEKEKELNIREKYIIEREQILTLKENEYENFHSTIRINEDKPEKIYCKPSSTNNILLKNYFNTHIQNGKKHRYQSLNDNFNYTSLNNYEGFHTPRDKSINITNNASQFHPNYNNCNDNRLKASIWRQSSSNDKKSFGYKENNEIEIPQKQQMTIENPHPDRTLFHFDPSFYNEKDNSHKNESNKGNMSLVVNTNAKNDNVNKNIYYPQRKIIEKNKSINISTPRNRNTSNIIADKYNNYITN